MPTLSFRCPFVRRLELSIESFSIMVYYIIILMETGELFLKKALIGSAFFIGGILLLGAGVIAEDGIKYVGIIFGIIGIGILGKELFEE